MAAVPETRYARTVDGVHIAFQVLGSGPPDLLFSPGYIFNVDAVWRLWPEVWADLFRRLATIGRLIMFDRRGTGLSDRIVAGDERMTLEARMDDLRAVMDAAGSKRAILIGLEDGFGLAAMFAATYPERTAALVGMSATPANLPREDYPGGFPRAEWDEELAVVERSWGGIEFAVTWGKEIWPHETDPAWFEDYATWMRSCASPGDAEKLLRVDVETDVCDLLPTIGVPALILHRVGNRVESVEVARYLAARIPGATLVELPGEDHGWVSRDQDRWVDEVRRFATRLNDEEADFDRILKTVVFTDIVDSTALAASLGDRGWKELVGKDHAVVRSMLARYRDEEVDTAGDGFFATFDGPARGVRCASAIVEGVRAHGIEVRAGVHTGEVETIDGKVGGIGVVIGARVGALANASEVVISRTVKDLTAGSGLAFQDAGEHELKGVPDRWRLYRVVT